MTPSSDPTSRRISVAAERSSSLWSIRASTLPADRTCKPGISRCRQLNAALTLESASALDAHRTQPGWDKTEKTGPWVKAKDQVESVVQHSSVISLYKRDTKARVPGAVRGAQ